MKKIKIFTYSCLMLSVLFSCASKKATVKAVGDVEITLPCSDFQNDKDYFRASQMGTSPDISSSIKTAEANTKRSLAGQIKTQIKDVTKIYSQDRNISDTREFSDKVETYTLAVINETLRELNPVCKKTTQKTNGEGEISYNTFMAYECSKDVIYNGIKKTLSNDQKLRQDYDEIKFKEVFDKEMDKLEKEQP